MVLPQGDQIASLYDLLKFEDKPVPQAAEGTRAAKLRKRSTVA